MELLKIGSTSVYIGASEYLQDLVFYYKGAVYFRSRNLTPLQNDSTPKPEFHSLLWINSH